MVLSIEANLLALNQPLQRFQTRCDPPFPRVEKHYLIVTVSSRTKENGTVLSCANNPKTLTVPCFPLPVP